MPGVTTLYAIYKPYGKNRDELVTAPVTRETEKQYHISGNHQAFNYLKRVNKDGSSTRAGYALTPAEAWEKHLKRLAVQRDQLDATLVILELDIDNARIECRAAHRRAEQAILSDGTVVMEASVR